MMARPWQVRLAPSPYRPSSHRLSRAWHKRSRDCAASRRCRDRIASDAPDGEARLKRFQCLRQVALCLLHVADLLIKTETSSCHWAFPGSDCAKRSPMARPAGRISSPRSDLAVRPARCQLSHTTPKDRVAIGHRPKRISRDARQWQDRLDRISAHPGNCAGPLVRHRLSRMLSTDRAASPHCRDRIAPGAA